MDELLNAKIEYEAYLNKPIPKELWSDGKTFGYVEYDWGIDDIKSVGVGVKGKYVCGRFGVYGEPDQNYNIDLDLFKRKVRRVLNVKEINIPFIVNDVKIEHIDTCLCCGEPINFSPGLCPYCKKAIMAMRRFLEDDGK